MANENQKDQQSLQRADETSPPPLAPRTAAAGLGLLAPFAPFTLMRRLLDDIDRLSESASAGDVGMAPWSDAAALWVPALEVFERDGKLVIRTELPGIKKEQLRIEAEPGRLILSGERIQDTEQKSTNFYRSERRYGSFRRAVALPEGVDPEQAKATFSDGILEITIPAPQLKTPRRIEIQEGPSNANAKPDDNAGQNAAPAA